MGLEAPVGDAEAVLEDFVFDEAGLIGQVAEGLETDEEVAARDGPLVPFVAELDFLRLDELIVVEAEDEVEAAGEFLGGEDGAGGRGCVFGEVKADPDFFPGEGRAHAEGEEGDDPDEKGRSHRLSGLPDEREFFEVARGTGVVGSR